MPEILSSPLLGQQAGEHITTAMIGFLITGVGLPLLAIVAIAKAGGDLQILANRVGPTFGVIFTSIVYLAIGPFLQCRVQALYLMKLNCPISSRISNRSLGTTFHYFYHIFAFILFLAINPSKLVDRVGKILTPVLLAVILLLAIKSFISPMGEPGVAIGKYTDSPLTEGFVQGYLTMDVLSALVFGIVILQALRDMGMSNTKSKSKRQFSRGLLPLSAYHLFISH